MYVHKADFRTTNSTLARYQTQPINLGYTPYLEKAVYLTTTDTNPKAHTGMIMDGVKYYFQSDTMSLANYYYKATVGLHLPLNAILFTEFTNINDNQDFEIYYYMRENIDQ